MTVSKAQFLNNLKNGSRPVELDQKDFKSLDSNLFSDKSLTPGAIFSIVENEGIEWIKPRYFDDLISSLNYEVFNEKRCLHALDVKKYLQNRKNIQGFIIDNDERQESNSAAQKPEDKTEENNQRIKDIDVNQLLNDKKNLLDTFLVTDILRESIEDAKNGNGLSKLKSYIKSCVRHDDFSVQDVLLTILYSYQKIPDLFEDYSVSKFSPAIDLNESLWDEQYLGSQMNYITGNFSLERLMHLINVLNKLNKKSTVSKLVKEKISSSSNQEKNYGKSDSNTSNLQSDRQKNFIKVAIAAGGVVLAVIIALFII
ncbi:hypothetical protein DC083_08995 [Ignatzschineria ureiclastica]|uniref:Uncharacterized protein n=1 Tax=Ignatzschineria ureiclastica TaxID=472582 RepID=A0A2U2ACP9_9GAMM|nr:hypothetical protein [Ignatzschineria ureiclastica]PWD80440.1 hypothetical protein DC083_08995 [Ignatzschineria ureiclastica]GGZ99500.1 hypothetical protein GCM10007162_14550 [Ignatzschineria ureiclastica]